MIFCDILVPSWFLRFMGDVAQNRLIPQKFHKNQNCRVSKSKIIMCLWSVALTTKKAGYRPRLFFTGGTVLQQTLPFFSWLNFTYHVLYSIFLHMANVVAHICTMFIVVRQANVLYTFCAFITNDRGLSWGNRTFPSLTAIWSACLLLL